MFVLVQAFVLSALAISSEFVHQDPTSLSPNTPSFDTCESVLQRLRHADKGDDSDRDVVLADELCSQEQLASHRASMEYGQDSCEAILARLALPHKGDEYDGDVLLASQICSPEQLDSLTFKECEDKFHKVESNILLGALSKEKDVLAQFNEGECSSNQMVRVNNMINTELFPECEERLEALTSSIADGGNFPSEGVILNDYSKCSTEQFWRLNELRESVDPSRIDYGNTQ